MKLSPNSVAEIYNYSWTYLLPRVVFSNFFLYFFQFTVLRSLIDPVRKSEYIPMSKSEVGIYSDIGKRDKVLEC